MATPTYPLAQTHPLLTPKVALLQPNVFNDNVVMAEMLLGVRGRIWQGAGLSDKAMIALAIQVNFQVHQGVDAHTTERVLTQNLQQTIVWRDKIVSPQAEMLWNEVVIAADKGGEEEPPEPGSGYNTLTSLRGGKVNGRSDTWYR